MSNYQLNQLILFISILISITVVALGIFTLSVNIIFVILAIILGYKLLIRIINEKDYF